LGEERYGDVDPFRGLRFGESFCLVVGDGCLVPFISDDVDALGVFIVLVETTNPIDKH
jgi:hypothetical protein